jgi:hypothetical protein
MSAMADPATGLTGPWLASRLGIDPVLLEARRRAGELFAVRPDGSSDWIYPSWQFDEDMNVRPEVERVLAAAREAEIGRSELERLLDRRVGLAGGQTMLDLLRSGDDQPLLKSIRAA